MSGCESNNMNQMIDDKWISLEEASIYLGVKPVTLRDWIKKQAENNIPAHKIGKLWKFKKVELDAWVKSGKGALTKTTPPEKPSRQTLEDKIKDLDPEQRKKLMAMIEKL